MMYNNKIFASVNGVRGKHPSSLILPFFLTAIRYLSFQTVSSKFISISLFRKKKCHYIRYIILWERRWHRTKVVQQVKYHFILFPLSLHLCFSRTKVEICGSMKHVRGKILLNTIKNHRTLPWKLWYLSICLVNFYIGYFKFYCIS